MVNRALNTDPSDPSFIVALSLQSASPKWLKRTECARRCYLMAWTCVAACTSCCKSTWQAPSRARSFDSDAADGTRTTLLRDKGIRDGGVNRVDQSIVVNFVDAASADQARQLLSANGSELQWTSTAATAPATGFQVIGTFTPAVQRTVQSNAIKQNITTLHNRVNELGVSEPVIQQQGDDRIVVELPGVQDTAKAKDIIGRTATLEARLADADAPRFPNPGDPVPPGDELFTQGNNTPVLLKKQVIFTGDRITDASAGFDEHQRPDVNITLDADGGRVLRSVSRDNIGKPMAIVLFEKGKGQVLTVATIPAELGERFHIRGAASTDAANDTGAAAARGFSWQRRWTSSKSAPSARAWARTISARASTRSSMVLPRSPCS